VNATVPDPQDAGDEPAGDEALDRTRVSPARRLPMIDGIALEREIGRGGMGVVFRGKQTILERPVAVKVIKTSAFDAISARFQREARLLSSISHPNIVTCYQAGMLQTGEGYLVMEFIDGPTLRQRLNETGRLEAMVALRVCRDIADALRCAHASGVIHRDVKPENIMLQRVRDTAPGSDFGFVPKLVDFGIARSGHTTDDITSPGMVIGTCATMAPEQFDAPHDIDHRADIYALGCVLFHALTGKQAFPQKTPAAVISAKQSPRPPRIDDAADVPKEVRRLVQAMLALRRDDRPIDYPTLIAQMNELLAGPKPVAAGPGAWRRWGAAAGALAAIAIAGWFVVDPPGGRAAAPGPVEGPKQDPASATTSGGGSDAENETKDTPKEQPKEQLKEQPKEQPKDQPEVGPKEPGSGEKDGPEKGGGEKNGSETGSSANESPPPPPVRNLPPTLRVVAPASAVAGSELRLEALGVDPDSEALTYSWQIDEGFQPEGLDLQSRELAWSLADAVPGTELVASVKLSDGVNDPVARTVKVKVDAAAGSKGLFPDDQLQELGREWKQDRQGAFRMFAGGVVLSDCKRAEATMSHELQGPFWLTGSLELAAYRGAKLTGAVGIRLLSADGSRLDLTYAAEGDPSACAAVAVQMAAPGDGTTPAPAQELKRVDGLTCCTVHFSVRTTDKGVRLVFGNKAWWGACTSLGTPARLEVFGRGSVVKFIDFRLTPR